MLFNLCGPHHSGLNAHLDAVTFRGIRIENSPVWLQNVMGRSGLFTEHLVKMAQVITWWYRGDNGTFTYWPDGPLGPPTRLEHPLWNKGVVVQNEMMFHRGDPVGRPDERDTPGLKHRSLIGYDAEHDDWAITTDGEVIRRYRPEQMRLLVHWSAEVYSDLDEVKKNLDHSDDLTHEVVFERLLADMRARGVNVAEPSDPLHDQAFIRALIATYSAARPPTGQDRRHERPRPLRSPRAHLAMVVQLRRGSPRRARGAPRRRLPHELAHRTRHPSARGVHPLRLPRAGRRDGVEEGAPPHTARIRCGTMRPMCMWSPNGAMRSTSTRTSSSRQITDRRPSSVSSGVVHWTLVRTGDGYRVRAQHTVLDSIESAPFHEVGFVACRQTAW